MLFQDFTKQKLAFLALVTRSVTHLVKLIRVGNQYQV